MNYWTQSPANIYVAAHRGWCGKYPENTMEAFRAALDLGVDQLETDVRITKDGELVLIHDATLDRTTNGAGLVRDYTLKELKALDAGSSKDPAFWECRIPTLKELMELVKDHPTITLDIELKEYPVDGRDAIAYEVCDRVLKMVDDYGFTDRVVINTWNGKLHEYIVQTYGSKYRQHVYYPVRHLGECTMNPYEYAYCTCVFGVGEEVSIADCKKLEADNNCRLWAGAYVKDNQGIDLTLALGAELITCNNPDEILDLLRKRGLHK